MSAAVELTVKGEVSVLRLAPGDRLVVTIDKHERVDQGFVTGIKDALEHHFPGHEIILLHGLSLAVEKR